jgi:dTDP-4-amino-4,6-dideoxygalactose transaminase
LQKTVPVNDLSRSWAATSVGAREACSRVLSSGRYVQGFEHDAFEAEFAAYLGVVGVRGVASGSEALELALMGVGCGPGSVVVCAPNAGGYSAIAAARIGARTVYADIDPSTHLLTSDSVAAVLDDDVTAVVVTHLYGNVADMPRIRELCDARGVRVVEDCAQAAGSRHQSGRVGSLGDAAAFSFYPTKNLGAAGDGGAVASNSVAVLEAVASLRNYGWGARYEIKHRGGFNSRLDEMQAAILRSGLPRLDSFNERRRDIVRAYESTLAGSALAMVTSHEPGATAHLAVIQARDPASRDLLRSELARRGIATAVHYPILDHRQPSLAPPVRLTSLTSAERVVPMIATVPCFPELADEEVARVCEALQSASALLS